ncbi:MAG: hypothetical protein Q8K93_14240, partial [Reyranella sp.]|nr:hypothetical protein [Reyranella sp.]
GLGDVDNTADAAKPVSDATQAALDDKLDASAVDTDPDMTADSDAVVPSQAAVVAYVAANAGGGGGGTLTEYTGTSVPATPTTGVEMFARKRAGKTRPAWVNPQARTVDLVPLVGNDNQFGWIVPAMGQAGSVAHGSLAPGFWPGATTAQRTPTTTNSFTRRARNALQTTSSANSNGGIRSAYSLGSQMLAVGGLDVRLALGISDYVAGMMIAAGLLASAIAPTGEPSDLVDCIFLGKDSTDLNLQIMHNDASGTCTKVDLGASFPADTANLDWYELRLVLNTDLVTVSYSVENKTTGVLAEGTLATNLPSNSATMIPGIWITNGATAAAARVDFGGLYVWSNP